MEKEIQKGISPNACSCVSIVRKLIYIVLDAYTAWIAIKNRFDKDTPTPKISRLQEAIMIQMDDTFSLENRLISFQYS
jgi:hypothetical protein